MVSNNRTHRWTYIPMFVQWWPNIHRTIKEEFSKLSLSVILRSASSGRKTGNSTIFNSYSYDLE